MGILFRIAFLIALVAPAVAGAADPYPAGTSLQVVGPAAPINDHDLFVPFHGSAGVDTYFTFDTTTGTQDRLFQSLTPGATVRYPVGDLDIDEAQLALGNSFVTYDDCTASATRSVQYALTGNPVQWTVT